MSRKAIIRRGGSAVLVALGAVILMVALHTKAQAQPLASGEQFAEHNGSIMRVLTDDRAGRMTIVYEIPRPGLAAFGVIPGTVLIDGRWIGQRPLRRHRSCLRLRARISLSRQRLHRRKRRPVSGRPGAGPDAMVRGRRLCLE